jgi:Fic family protein
MKKNEQLTEKAAATMAERVKENVQIFREAEERRELDINKIEAMWGTTKAEINKVVDELYGDLVNGISEKELAKDKKKVSKKRQGTPGLK